MRVGTFNRIVIAAICAAAATYLTVSYVAPAATTTKRPVTVQETRPVAVLPPSLDTRTVVVATVPLRFGAVLTPDVLAEVPWPVLSVPPGAFSSREALLGPGGQRTVVSAIGKHEPVLASKITGPGQRGTLASVIDDGKRAITIRVDDVLGVAGFVQPDDRVDVLLTRYDRPAMPTAQPSPGSAYTSVLLQNVRVLAVDQLADRGTQAKPARAVTVEVTPEDAQKVPLAASVGQLSLTLRPAGSTAKSTFGRVGLDDLGGKKHRSDVPVVQDPSDTATVVTVTRGANERSAYEITAAGRREVKLSGGAQQKQSQGDQEAAQLIAKPE